MKFEQDVIAYLEKHELMFSIIVVLRIHLREDDEVGNLISRARDCLERFAIDERLQQIKCL